MVKRTSLPKVSEGPLVEYHYYCPNKRKEGTFFAVFPALEACPNPDCGNLRGKGDGKCNFLILPNDLHSVGSGIGMKSIPKMPRSFTSEFNIGDTVKTVGTEELVV